MKNYLIILLLFLSSSIYCQDNSETTFDFWLGDWEAKWYNPDSSIIYGSNSITKILDGKVIEENFISPTQNFKGKSLSVYNPIRKSWHQAWTDNQGGYYDFIGLFEKDRRIFSTDTSKKIIQRMVFYNIQKDSFSWDWESSRDAGKTYQLSWRIFYTRKN